jgi:RNase P subunit RPR2
MTKLLKYLKRLFCKHEQSLIMLTETPISSEVYVLRTYRCRKCGKLTTLGHTINKNERL